MILAARQTDVFQCHGYVMEMLIVVIKMMNRQLVYRKLQMQSVMPHILSNAYYSIKFYYFRNYKVNHVFNRCANNYCIPGRWRCDHENDCGDRSDEVNCVYRNCTENEFRCNNELCIRSGLRCDGENNCGDGSDEENCPKSCSDDEFLCPNQNLCISNSYVCDHEFDCLNGADERNCTCPSGNFRCSNGECISIEWTCDGMNDCKDGSDELLSLCKDQACTESYK